MGTTTNSITDPPTTAGGSLSNTADALNNDAAKKEIDEFKNTLMGGLIKFLTEIWSILTVVLIWGFICANLISFIRPDSKSKSGSFTNTIMERLDQFFPHDIEKAPYGFDKTRGIANQTIIDEYEKAKKAQAAKDADADAGEEANPNKECKFDKFFIFKDEKATEFPYTWSAQPLVKNTDLADPVKMIIEKSDKEKDTVFMIGKRIKSFKDFALEWLVNAVYFSYGNHRQLIKTMFRMLNHYMKEKTPSSLKDGDKTKEDNESQYEYMSNLMVMLHIPLLFILILLFFGLGIGSIMMIAGSIWNQLPVKNYEFQPFRLLEGIPMTLVFGSFTVFPFAAAAYFIQPAMFFGKLLFYQLFCEKDRANLKKTFIEIVPALVTIFALGVCYSAFYNFPEPFSYVLVIGAIIAFSIVFKDNISNLFMFLGMWKSNILKTKTIPKEPSTTNVPVTKEPEKTEKTE